MGTIKPESFSLRGYLRTLLPFPLPSKKGMGEPSRNPIPAKGGVNPAGVVLLLATAGFTLAFAAWMVLGVLAIPLREELGCTNQEMGWAMALCLLGGALPRPLFGIAADRYGGKRVFSLFLLVLAPLCLFLSKVQSYGELLLLSFLIGLAGNSFAIGVSWCSAWAPPEKQGLYLGVFGAGNVGASLGKLLGPLLMAVIPREGFFGGTIPGGWRFLPVLYALLLAGAGLMMAAFAPSPERKPQVSPFPRAFLEPLRSIRVWRFGLYYTAVFGAYVALSLWLPRYYVDRYGFPLGVAALLTAIYIYPAALLRPLGGYLADRLGARRVNYAVFLSLSLLSLLAGIPGLLPGAVLFTLVVFLMGVAMGIGKGSVYKYIPLYFPKNVGGVGGQVGMLGALGGFFLPLLWGDLEARTGRGEFAFLVLFGLSLASLVWLHLVVRKLARLPQPLQGEPFEFFSDPESREGRVELQCNLSSSPGDPSQGSYPSPVPRVRGSLGS